jgi:hypothetical protein
MPPQTSRLASTIEACRNIHQGAKRTEFSDLHGASRHRLQIRRLLRTIASILVLFKRTRKFGAQLKHAKKSCMRRQVSVAGDSVLAVASMGAFHNLYIFSIPDQSARQSSWRYDVGEFVQPENIVSCQLRIYLELLIENSVQLVDDLQGENKSQSSLHCRLKDASFVAVIQTELLLAPLAS